MQTTPHNERAERVLLAGLLREPQLVTEACIHHGVTRNDLYFHSHRLVWDAVYLLIDCGSIPDLPGVWQVLVCKEQTRELGPQPALWLAEVWEEDPTGAWCDWACGEIVATAQERAEILSAVEFLKEKTAGRYVPDVRANIAN